MVGMLFLALASAPLHSPQQVDLRHRDALALMQAKGLLASDLPPEVAALEGAVSAAQAAGDCDRAFALADELGRALARIAIDRAFLDAKLRRLAGHLPGKAPGAPDLEAILKEATSLAADGQYGSANARLNRLAAMLQ